MNLNMHQNRFSSNLRPHLSKIQRIQEKQIPCLASKTSPKKYLTLSKDFSKNMGITIQRKNRMSMEKLYNDEVFSFLKNQESSKHTSSTATMTSVWSPKSERGSNNFLNSLSGSKVSNTQISINFKSESREDLRKQQVFTSYYAQPEPVKRYETKIEKILRKPIEQRPITQRKYDIKRVIRFD